MYRAMTAPVLEPVGDGKVALKSVNVEAVIENLLCEVNIRQVYKNLGDQVRSGEVMAILDSIYRSQKTGGEVRLD